MATTVEGRRIGDWLKYELDPRYNREEVTIAAAPAHLMASGTILGKVIATGAYVPLDPLAIDGSQTPAAVLCFDIDATVVAVRTPIIVRGPVMLSRDDLTYPVGAPPPVKATIQSGLAAIGLVPRITV